MRAESRAREVRTGIFVMLGLVILIALTLWISGSNPFEGKKEVYEILMKNAGGVRTGDQVRVAGVQVGRVESIALRDDGEWPVAFRVALDKKVAITSASRAQFASDGILGSRFLSIDPGPAGAPRLGKGKAILGKKTGDMTEALTRLDEVVDRALLLLDESTRAIRTFSDDVGPLMGRLNALLSEENVDHLTVTLRTMRRTLDETGPRLPALLTQLETTLEDLGEGVRPLPEVTAEGQALLADLRTALGPDGQRLTDVLESADGTLDGVAATLDAVSGNAGELEAALGDLRTAAANLRALSEALKEQPSRLIRTPRKPDRRPGQGVER